MEKCSDIQRKISLVSWNYDDASHSGYLFLRVKSDKREA